MTWQSREHNDVDHLSRVDPNVGVGTRLTLHPAVVSGYHIRNASPITSVAKGKKTLALRGGYRITAVDREGNTRDKV